MEAGKVTIWLAIESTRTPPTWRATVDEILSAVHQGGTHDGSLVGGGAQDDDPDVDARRTRRFIQIQAVKST
jgi:hypothetical protein